MTYITASVVLYNTPETQLKRLLECLERSEICKRLYLIDNSPIPTELPLFHLPWVTYVNSRGNVGYGAGHNVAIRLALDSSDFHFVLNPDIYFEPNELSKMIQRMKEDATIGQLMPKVIYPNGNLQYLCKLIPTPSDLIFRRFLIGPLRSLAQDRLDQFELKFTGYECEMDVPYLSGCFMLFRVSSLKQIGLFDERFFMYPEDIDITRRMHSVYRTIFYPEARIVHDHARESYKSWRMLWIHTVNIIKYFNKWGWFFDHSRKITNTATIKALTSRSSINTSCT